MRILQINTTVNSGSTGRIAEDIGKVLMANGHESYIAYGRGNQKSQSKLIKIGTQIDLYFHRLKTKLFDRHGFGSKKATKDLIVEIEKVNPDVIGLHNIHGYYINIEILFNFIAKKKIPVLWTFHDCWSFTGHCTFFDSIGCEKWKTQCEKCPKINSYPSSMGMDNSYYNYNTKKHLINQLQHLKIITPSQWLRKLTLQSYLKKFPVACIHNGIDLSLFRPIENTIYLTKKLDLINKKVLLGVASIWDKRKGLEDFVKLSTNLPNEYQIILIGLSDKQIKCMPKNIIGVKRTESITELAAYYSLAHVFVNPTYQDNFPTTNIEALACGTPVITYDTGGSPEAIDSETGEAIQKGEIQLLKQAIEKWCLTNSIELSKKCRKRAEILFNKEDRYLEYLEIYNKILEDSIIR